MYEPTLHMGPDQYSAFSTLSTTFDQLHIINSQWLFFITGSAGVGKSYLLLAIQQNLDSWWLTYVKLTPTGIAAVNIQGQMIHSALSMMTSNFGNRMMSYVSSIFQSEEKLMEMKGYQVLLIDEISMVSAEMLTFISSTFGQLHGNAKPFGGICVIAFGDLLQLPPIVGQQVFKCML